VTTHASKKQPSRLNSQIDAWERSQNRMLRALARLVRIGGALRRFLLNPRIRSEQITRLLHRKAHIQAATFSERNRYPELFAACAHLLAGLPSPIILSFGCATGEEAFSLAEYMPNATIIGVDINRWCLAQARRANRSSQIRFLHSLSSEYAALRPVDAIFAMAVFQRSENRNRTAPLAYPGFRFKQFAQQIARLDALLKPGGLFFIDHTDFRFEDTAIAASYTPLKIPGSPFTHERPLFGSDNKLIATSYTMHRAFQKQPS
jgi:SAM-dependent methyltransferase